MKFKLMAFREPLRFSPSIHIIAHNLQVLSTRAIGTAFDQHPVGTANYLATKAPEAIAPHLVGLTSEIRDPLMARIKKRYAELPGGVGSELATQLDQAILSAKFLGLGVQIGNFVLFTESGLKKAGITFPQGAAFTMNSDKFLLYPGSEVIPFVRSVAAYLGDDPSALVLPNQRETNAFSTLKQEGKLSAFLLVVGLGDEPVGFSDGAQLGVKNLSHPTISVSPLISSNTNQNLTFALRLNISTGNPSPQSGTEDAASTAPEAVELPVSRTPTSGDTAVLHQKPGTAPHAQRRNSGPATQPGRQHGSIRIE